MGDNVNIGGFTVLRLKLYPSSTAEHYIYLKEHNVKDIDNRKPNKRTLFVLNIPPFCSQNQLRVMFYKLCGPVQDVYLQSRPSGKTPNPPSHFFPVSTETQGFKVAYIVFKKVASVQKAIRLSYDESLVLLKSDQQPVLTAGMQKWCNEYENGMVDRESLQKDIDTYMTKFDKKVQEDLELEKAKEGVPDEDGWVTVTRTSKKAAPLTERHQEKAKMKEKGKKKRKELLNFYAFQMRDTKKEQIAQLRQKFEEDKQRIALMKASRKFKPY